MSEVRERASWFKKLEKLDTTVDALDANTVTPAAVKAYFEEAERIWTKIDAVHTLILDNTRADDAYELQMDAIEPMETMLVQIKTKLFALSSTVSTGTRRNLNVKLPDMPLPEFTGSFDEWKTFSDLFDAAILKNTNLTGSQRLQYLKSCVKGEAASIISSFAITDANFAEAWNLLKERYDNNREIIHSLVKKLLFQPSVKVESAASMQQLLNTTQEVIRSLKVMGRPTDTWDDIVTVLLIEKFDVDTKAEWARSLTGTDPPTYAEVVSFITKHVRTLLAKESLKSSVKPQQQQQRIPQGKLRTHTTTLSTCPICQGSHPVHQCGKLKEMDHKAKTTAIKAARLCFNCLRGGHMSSDCQSGTCKKCEKKHHTLLHWEEQKTSNKRDSSSQEQSSSSSNASSSSSKQLRINQTTFLASATVLLKTAVVDVINSVGIKTSLRILLDEGGEGCLIREDVMKRMGFRKDPVKVTVSGVGDLPAMKSHWLSYTTLYSQVNNCSINVSLYAVPKVTGTLNRLKPGELRTWSHIRGLQLADPHFMDGGNIDILLGSDVVPYLLKGGLKILNNHSPVAQETVFGWVLSGKVGEPTQTTFRIHSFECEISRELRRFWEVEEVPSLSSSLTPEEQICEDHFVSTHTRLEDGRYMVRLPFNDKKEQLGESKNQAYRRLIALEKRFEREPQHKQAYVDFMRDYEQLKHMEKVEWTTKQVITSFYLPHHFVIKQDSSTTKLRCVYDGSAKTTSGTSLNDALRIGATVQADLFTLLLKFRYNPVALKADIAKMYRQFPVHPADRDYQRILWREDPKQPVQEYRLTTVTYGTASAPFLATRALNQLATDEKENYPAAAEALLCSTYVDDYIGTSKSVNSAVNLVQEMIQLVAKGGMEIRKWCSNKTEVMESIPESLRENCNVTELGDSDSSNCIKALGIRWKPSSDEFLYTAVCPPPSTPTKRLVLSEISKTFDPLGWLSPVTVNAKLIMQRIWIGGHDWDDKIPDQLNEQWTNYIADLQRLSEVRIPRCVVTSSLTTAEIHGYCDSSELAYSCAIYLKCTYQSGSSSSHLLTARTRVAPIKCVSLPKLELCGAELLAKTMEVILKTISFPHTVFCWTDSTISLRWITSHSRKWKTFVANRVSTIQTIIPPAHWGHVRSKDNPADLPSRGISTEELLVSDLWWHGPSWLLQGNYPNSTVNYEDNEEEVRKEEKAKSITCLRVTASQAHTLLFCAFASLNKLLRCASYFLRIIEYLRKKRTIPMQIGVVTATELATAKRALIRWSQAISFSKEIFSLQKKIKLPSSSKLSTLHPFIDANGIVRVGGRIQNASLPDGGKHPIIIGHDHKLAELIISHCHIVTCHGGFTITHSRVRQEFWILRGRDTIRYHIRKCVICRKANAKTATQLMGSLPTGRVVKSRPFLCVGVDFAGPFLTKVKKGRHFQPHKTWFCVFVCLSTKAVHLEAVTSLSTEAFIACYERFVSRRGISCQILSDCGTNFVGAEKQLHQFLKDENAYRGTTWIFNPPSAPHQGGLWEASVKSVKKHFYRVVGQRVLLLEEFQTLLAKIEAILNSRPLCAMSSDPCDFDALTPSHFLIGEPLLNIPEPDLTIVTENRLKQWDIVRQLNQHFWKRWSMEYLTSLQQRFKWKEQRDNLKVGDLVVIADDQQPVTKWKLGRIITVFPGTDGLVRSALLKTATGELKRPITKLSPLFHVD